MPPIVRIAQLNSPARRSCVRRRRAVVVSCALIRTKQMPVWLTVSYREIGTVQQVTYSYSLYCDSDLPVLLFPASLSALHYTMPYVAVVNSTIDIILYYTILSYPILNHSISYILNYTAGISELS